MERVANVRKSKKLNTEGNTLLSSINKYKAFYIMLLPLLIYYLIFHYAPMFGIRYAFYEYGIGGLGDFIGLENFKELFRSESFIYAFRNTLILSLINLFLQMVLAITMALLLNEINSLAFKKVIQTAIYLPHFISWVVVASIFTMILSPETGAVNQIIKFFGGDPVYFLANEKWWRPVFFLITRWKETGYACIIYIASMASIDPQLYEAAEIDGAGKLKQTMYITLPSLKPTILVVLILTMAKVLNVFESVFVLYNPLVYKVSDVIQTYAYREGLINANYGYATAVGLFKSFIALILVLITNTISKKAQGESVL